MHFIQSYSTTMDYKGLPVRVPEPEAFVLMKYLLTIERTGKYKTKISKNISTAKNLGFFLLEKGSQEQFVEYFRCFSSSSQNALASFS